MDDDRIAEQKAEYKPRNLRIISLRTARRILHIEDVLELARVRVELWAYEKGEGASGHADAYLDVDIARVLAAFLASGSVPEPIEETGGGLVGGILTARIFRLEEAEGTKNPIRISVTNGPGTRQPSGLITLTQGARVEKVQMLISRMDARRIGLALAEHLQAWATHTYGERLAAGTWQPADSPQGQGSLVYDASPSSPGEESVPEGMGEDAPEPKPAAISRPSGERAAPKGEREKAAPAVVTTPGALVKPAAPEVPASSAVVEPAGGEVAPTAPTLRYGNGAAVGQNDAEIQAYHAYVAAEQEVPVSVDALRAWLRRTMKGRQS